MCRKPLVEPRELHALVDGPLFWIRDWPNLAVPGIAAGFCPERRLSITLSIVSERPRGRSVSMRALAAAAGALGFDGRVETGLMC